MPDFLKGNYQVPDSGKKKPSKKAKSQSLTDQFEESALAKLGGSLCFVMKDATFVWTGDEEEEEAK